MGNLPTDYWAKTLTDENGEVVSWLPLVDHLLDVGMAFEALLACGYGRALAHCIDQDDLSPEQKDFLCFLASMHDIGKLNVGFQSKPFRERGDRTGATGGHTSEILAGLLRHDSPLFEAVWDEIGLSVIGGWIKTTSSRRPVDHHALFLLASTFGHHGWPVRIGGLNGHRTVYAASECRPQWVGWRYADPPSVSRQIRKAAETAWPRAFGQPAPFRLTPAFLDGFNGLVTLADWIGSDQSRFPIDRPAGDKVRLSRDLAYRAVQENGIRADRLKPLAAKRPVESVFGFTPNAMQSAVWSTVGADTRPGLWILEAETGGGKTEAALGFLHRLLSYGKVDSLYLALPTRTSASQIHSRTSEFVQSAFDGSTPTVLAVPGYLRDQDATPLFPDSVHDDSGAVEKLQPWAQERPKRYLAAALAVGTIDQLLAGVIHTKHSSMRWAAASRSLLVIDEVHSSDTYGEALICEAVRRHIERGGYVLAMSATLGAATRARLQAAAKGADRARCIPDLQESTALRYPLLTIAHRSGPASLAPDIASPDRQKRVSISVETTIADVEAIARQVARHVSSGARVLVVRNTVTGTVALQRALEAILDEKHFVQISGVPIVHHGRFSPDDRIALDRAVEAAFGKGSARHPSGLVLVGTQTLEQSIDIDADVLFTDLCPMDVLLQRIGRLHRHDRQDRPYGYESAKCFVLAPSGALIEYADRGRHGIGGLIYQDVRILHATLEALSNASSIVLPRDNRTLVERATHPSVLDAYEDDWSAHSMKTDGRKSADMVFARSAFRPRPDPETDHIPQRGELDERIATRLGASSLQLDLPRAVIGPFKILCRQINVSSWNLSGLELGLVPEVTCEEIEGGISLHLAGRDFVYDRYGLRAVA